MQLLGKMDMNFIVSASLPQNWISAAPQVKPPPTPSISADFSGAYRIIQRGIEAAKLLP
jgi:hypothetical protein